MPSRDAGRTARLFVLGTLEASGPTHGHELRLIAERIDIGEWSDASVGSIYNAIRRLEEEGLIEAVRSERQGRRPTRTVYAITAAGGIELAALRDKLLHGTTLPSDPYDVAFWISAGLPAQELRAAVQARGRSLEERRIRLEHERERLTAAGYLPVAGQLLLRHGELRLEAELRWQEEILRRLAELGVPG